MSEYPSSTGVHAKISRWFDDPSNALIAKPSPEKWLWMYSAILSGSPLRVRPSRQESPLLVDGLPVQAHRGDRCAVHVVEVRAVGSVLRNDLRMHGLMLGPTRKLGIRTVIPILVGRELRELMEEVG